MWIQTNAGKLTILQLDESTRQIADSDADEWFAGDEVIQAELDGYDWKWIPTKAIDKVWRKVNLFNRLGKQIGETYLMEGWKIGDKFRFGKQILLIDSCENQDSAGIWRDIFIEVG